MVASPPLDCTYIDPEYEPTSKSARSTVTEASVGLSALVVPDEGFTAIHDWLDDIDQ